MAFKKLKIEALVQAPISRVWECWTRPEHITQWNFASDDWCCPSARVDLRPGGNYCARMEAKDGSMGFDFEAKYEDVVHEGRVALLLGDGRRAVTQFERLGNDTRVVTVFDAETQNSLELQQQGWQAILNQFKKHVEG